MCTPNQAGGGDRECPTDRKEVVEKFLRSSTEELQAKQHISTKYPPLFMPAPTLQQRLLKWLFLSTIICLVGLFLYVTIRHDISDDHTVYWALIVACPVLIILTSICLCSLYPLEYIDKLNFLAVQIINLGAIINMIFGYGNYILATEEDWSKALGSFFGIALLTMGTIMFSMSTFVLGPWEFMVGSPLLSIGLLCRSCAAYITLLSASEDPSSLAVDLNITACPFFFVALVFVFKKAYQLMRLPILGRDNYKFFGLAFYGGSIMANGVMNIILGTSDSAFDDETYASVVSITNSLAFFGTSIFLLDASRAKHHYNAVLEDRYPSTLCLIRHERGFATASAASFVALLASFAAAVVVVVSPLQQTQARAEFVSSLLVGLSIFAICGIGLYPSLRLSMELKEKRTTKTLFLIITGCLLLAIGNFFYGAFSGSVASTHGSIDALKAHRWFNICSICGSIVLVISTLLMEGAPCKVILTKPLTWENVYHPCNYVLLASLWLLFGASFKFAAFNALGSICNTQAFTVLLLHFNMSFYVWESMTLQSDGKEIDATYLCNDDWFGTEEFEAFQTKQQDIDSFDVIICGGGISGLFLAAILGKAGIKVLICEKRRHSVTDARFAVLNAASMEHMVDVLDSDILHELASRALPESTHYGSMLLNGLGHSKARVIDAANSPSRRVLMENLGILDDWTESRTLGSRYASQLPLRIMQSHQEDVLKMQLSRYTNVTQLNGWMLKNFRIDKETGVEAILVEVDEDEDGGQLSSHTGRLYREKLVQAKYIIGCDGPSSFVAKKLQVKFDGLLNLAKTRSLLVHIPGLYKRVIQTLGNTHQYQIIRKNFGLAAVVAADPYRDLWNVLFVFGEKAQKAAPEEVCKQFFGVDNFLVVQNRSWYWNFFIAREFRKEKRAFLVGDSAHSWPPFGALGGNSAYGDAINLGWKLALACKGKASDLLLESYAIERRQHILQTAMYVMRATPQPELMQLLTSRAFYNPLYMPFIRAGWYHHNSGTHGSNHFSQSGTQLGIKLNFSPVIMREEVVPADDPSCEYKPTFYAGARLPFLPFSEDDGGNLFSLLNSVGYTILVINDECICFANELASKVEERGVAVSLCTIPSVDASSYQGNHRRIADLLLQESLLVIRPDHVIAWRLRDVSLLGPEIINETASKITGIDQDGNCIAKQFQASHDAKTIKCYQRWLTREFNFSLRPYKFRFPKSVPVRGLEKKDSIKIVKSKIKKSGDRFTTTTKQGAEKMEGAEFVRASGAEPKLMRSPSDFELNKSEVNPIGKLIKLASEREANSLPVYNLAAGNPAIDPPKEIT